jgi:hypothetical protein
MRAVNVVIATVLSLGALALAQERAPGERPAPDFRRALESEPGTITFVVDDSASMGWDMGCTTSPNSDGTVTHQPRIQRARTQLARALRALPRSFKFTVFSFAGKVAPWRVELMSADEAHTKEAEAWIATLEPHDGSAIGPAVAAALSVKGSRLVVLLTNGAPDDGAGDDSGESACVEAHRQMIRQANRHRIPIDVFGIGAFQGFVGEQFCEDVASDSGGRYQRVN